MICMRLCTNNEAETTGTNQVGFEEKQSVAKGGNEFSLLIINKVTCEFYAHNMVVLDFFLPTWYVYCSSDRNN